MIYLDTGAMVILIRREPESDALVRTTAASYAAPDMRSLDAIHLATAQAVFGSQLTSFVSYDKRLLGIAERLHLPIASPGAFN